MALGPARGQLTARGRVGVELGVDEGCRAARQASVNVPATARPGFTE